MSFISSLEVLQTRRMNLSECSESKIQDKIWYVYICESRTGKYYVGISTSPVRRLERHNFGRGSRLAKDQGPFELVYVSPNSLTKSEARRREVQLKGWSRIKKERLIEGIWR